jgi:FkbM family methyltransferase
MLKKIVQSTLRAFGVELRWSMTPEHAGRLVLEERQRRLGWLRKRNIRTIIDVGANTGQFSQFISTLLPDVRIFAFEPLPDCFEQLERSFRGREGFRAFNLAIGNQSGTVMAYRNDYTPSSSLLPMAELHKSSFPHTRNGTPHAVTVERLDTVLAGMAMESPILLKLDVQGFEREVLLGAVQTLRQADVVLTELSVECLYENQPLFGDIYAMLVAEGFQYCGNWEQLHCPEDGRVLQMDGIFCRVGIPGAWKGVSEPDA